VTADCLRRIAVTDQSFDDSRDDVFVDVPSPNHIQVLVTLQGNRNAVGRQLLQHEIYIDEAVGVTVEQNYWGGNILCWEAGGVICSGTG